MEVSTCRTGRADCRLAGSNEQSQPQACHDNTATSVDGATFVSAMLYATTRAAAPSVLALRSSPPHSNEPSDDDDSSAVCVCFCVRSGSSRHLHMLTYSRTPSDLRVWLRPGHSSHHHAVAGLLPERGMFETACGIRAKDGRSSSHQRASRSRGRIQNGDKKTSSAQKGSTHLDHCLYSVGSIISNFVLVKVKFDVLNLCADCAAHGSRKCHLHRDLAEWRSHMR